MATIVVVFKILFLVLIAHSFVAQASTRSQLLSSLVDKSFTKQLPHNPQLRRQRQLAEDDQETKVEEGQKWAPRTRRSRLSVEAPKQAVRFSSKKKQRNGEIENWPNRVKRHLSAEATSLNKQADEPESAVLVDESSSSTTVGGSDRTAGLQSPGAPVKKSLAEGAGIAGEQDNINEAVREINRVVSASRRIDTDIDNADAPASAAAPETAAGGQVVNYAELCYLSNGGSSLTLTVNEATQVGSIIGTVDVNGDPSLEGGNVDLFDSQETAPQTQTSGLSAKQQTVNSNNELPVGELSVATANSKQQRRVLGRRSAVQVTPLVDSAKQQPQSQLANSTSFMRLITSSQATPHLSSSGGSQPTASPATTANLVRLQPADGGDELTGESSSWFASSPSPSSSPQVAASHRQREPKMVGSSAPPIHGQQNQHQLLMGLVSEHQSTSAQGANGSGHSASFYSLVAGTAPASSATTTSVTHSSDIAATPTSQQQQQQAVRLEPGTRNLILARQLDKESVEGEQGIVINVRCRPRSTDKPGRSSSSDPSTIPVRIIVTDANDHAPEFLGPQPYVVNISETTPIGAAASRDILATDRDSAGPFSTLHYRVLEDGSPHSALLQFSNPLDPTLLVAAPLDYESLGGSFTLTIVAQDQGEPEPLSSTAQVQVNIIDFDDQNPRFLDDKYTLIMDETQQSLVGQNLQVLPRNLYAEDGDKGIGAPILYSFDQLGGPFQSLSVSGGGGDETTSGAPSLGGTNSLTEEPSINIERYLHLNPTSGEIRLIRQWPSKWMGSPMTLVVRATQADNKDRYTLTTLTITRPSNGGAASTLPAQSMSSLGRAVAISTSSGAMSSTSSGMSSSVSSSQVELTQQQQSSGRSSAHGIEFTPDKLAISVPENVAINEKIARVRAKYLGKGDWGEPGSLLDSSSQVVDLVPDWQQQSGSNKTVRKTRVAELQQAAAKRPINYQILDDQTDQFGINGLGEIFVKRQLDYEQRQEYKFRVLATYTKYSDICQVQVSVLNVNDNKPKFTQPQYTFHLTESRLRSNVIGIVLAHDADLNDTIQYSISGEHAHLLNINPAGQISLRSGIKQLNITSCQLIVHATDSLAPPYHSHQARVNLHVAPQLVGRSINFEHHQTAASSTTSTTSDQEAKLFNSRSLLESRDQQLGAEWTSGNPGSGQSAASFSATGAGHRSQANGAGAKEAISNQRSSVATVMSSLQHMVRSVNFFDMPMSSALLLSALLAFLVCLLFIVIISMSVHFYRRRAKLRHSRHRHHLATAAHLRHTHLAAAFQHTTAGSGVGAQDRSLYMNQNHHSTSSPSTNSSPTNSTAAGNSPNYLSPPLPTNNSNNNHVLTHSPQHNQAVATIPTGVGKSASRPNSVQTNRTNSRQSAHSSLGRSIRSPLETLSAQLQSATRQTSLNGGGGNSELSSNKRKPGSAIREHTAGDNSLISSLSSHSKRSYRSNTTDDSSVMHCGHYSVNVSQSPQQQLVEASSQSYSSAASSRVQQPITALKDTHTNRKRSIEAAIKSLVRDNEEMESPNQYTVDLETIEMVNEEAATTTTNQHQQRRRSKLAELKPNELSVLTSSKPGIKSYRKLPLMNSLVRPIRHAHNRVGVATTDTTSGVPLVKTLQRNLAVFSSGEQQLSVDDDDQLTGDGANGGQRKDTQDSAIASDASSSGNSGGQPQSGGQSTAGAGEQQLAFLQREQQRRQNEGLMAMIRDPDRRLVPTDNFSPQIGQSLRGIKSFKQQEGDSGSGQVTQNEQDQLTSHRHHHQQANNTIRWPQGAIPHRVKKLTWDDELSIANEECFIAPELDLGSCHHQIGSPLSNHQYPIQGTTDNEDHYAEQHFLFSNPCSPALVSTDFTSFGAAGQQQQQSQQFQNRQLTAGTTAVSSGDRLPSLMMANNNLKDQSRPSSSSQQLADEQHLLSSHSIMGQNNCFDYTIVQSSQFHVDSFASERLDESFQQHQQSLSAQHHLLQQQQQQSHQTGAKNNNNRKPPIVATNYLYSSNGGSNSSFSQVAPTNQDLNLMTTAVL